MPWESSEVLAEKNPPSKKEAQEVLRPWLRPELERFLFSPAEAETERQAERAASRKTPPSCGNRPGTNRKRAPKKKE